MHGQVHQLLIDCSRTDYRMSPVICCTINIDCTLPGLLLMDDLMEGTLSLVSGVDTGCLFLLSLQFDSQFSLWLAIDCL